MTGGGSEVIILISEFSLLHGPFMQGALRERQTFIFQLSAIDTTIKGFRLFALSSGNSHDEVSSLNTCQYNEPDKPTSERHQQVGSVPSSHWPKRTAFRVCRECGGRRIIPSAAGPLPCPACVPWRRRPEYQPDRKLLTEEDINLKPLNESHDDAKQIVVIEEHVKGQDRDEGYNEEPRSKSQPGKRARGQMTEEKRLAIRNSMKKRGPLRNDHKTRISNAMRRRYAADPSLRQAGKPKRCSYCGEVGHNRRACPKRANDNDIEKESDEDTAMRYKVSTTSKLDDPIAPIRKVIIIEEEEKNYEVIGSENETVNRDDAANYDCLTNEKSTPKPDKSVVADSPPKTVISNGSIIFPLPVRPEQCVLQAAGAVLRAWEDGIRRQNLEILLPQAGSANDRGWPGGIRQQFRVALPMVEGLLKRLKLASSLQGRITAEWLDEGDCVGAWQSERLAAVLFPTAETLPAVRRIDDALSGKRLMLVVNSQWQPQGQIVSDFGFGKARRQAERFVESLESVYSLRRVRVLGDEIRILRCYPGSWQVYFVRSASNTELLSVEDDQPTYQRLLELCRNFQGSRSSKSWLDRVLDGRSFDEIAAYEDDFSDMERSSGDGAATEDSFLYSPSNASVEVDIVTGEILR
jgi:hypothetical protein